MSTVGILHPGEMGAAVGRCLRDTGHTVLWASAGRSAATVARAEAAGLLDVDTVEAVTERAEVVLSICPPHAALDTARLAVGTRGLYVDANAVAPSTIRSVADIVPADVVDGGIIGPPPHNSPAHNRASTRLYLSGPRADEIAGLFEGSALEARVLPQADLGAASALKAAYAAWSKGTAALLLTIRGFARAEGIEPALLTEWALSQPNTTEQSERAAQSADTKGWRWIGEMEEIATALRDRDLPDGFHLAAAEVYRRWPDPPVGR